MQSRLVDIESLFRKILETSLSANIVQGTPNLGRGGGGVQRFFRNKPKISGFFRNKQIFCTNSLELHTGIQTSTERNANSLKYPEYQKFSPAALEYRYNQWSTFSPSDALITGRPYTPVMGWLEVPVEHRSYLFSILLSHFRSHSARQTLWIIRSSTKLLFVLVQ